VKFKDKILSLSSINSPNMLKDHINNITVGSGALTGTRTLKPNTVEMVSIPLEGKNITYFMDKVAAAIGGSASDVIELVKSYPNADVSQDKFQIYVPDVSGASAEFDLVVSDGVNKESNPFYVFTKNTFVDPIVINWSSEDV